ncbi:Hemolysin-type calcium-binding repeat-containing protein [Tranquillimonas rosea]|uniref:Hemolysin-type calcium-binding repeat-containing protein n=1 Tax=Tranquillimonas rosea TaxID=641238 RepID=A0A1H9X0G5_9RHOB|nr:calcium-binding protein [Tranquillimonas rosea]SES39143.1 Hemolysin-type calcium-binding repeat-containing protein [Tranquillimonas rosea]
MLIKYYGPTGEDFFRDAFFDSEDDEVDLDFLSVSPTRIVGRNEDSGYVTTLSGTGLSDPDEALTGTITGIETEDAAGRTLVAFSDFEVSFEDFAAFLIGDLEDNNPQAINLLFGNETELTFDASQSVEAMDDPLSGLPIPITHIGSDFADFLAGGSADDVLRGGTGNDDLYARDGADTIYGGAGDDEAGGGTGDDTIWMGAGDDTVYAGAGDDLIGGAAGDDEIWAGAGNDTVYAGGGAERIGAGTGTDEIWAGGGNDTVYGVAGDNDIGGGDGDDEIWAGTGADSVLGGDGDDLIMAGWGNDTAWGGNGADTLNGIDGDDRLGGGDGSDVLTGGFGNDTLLGGDGADTFVFGAGHGNDRIADFELGVDTIEIGLANTGFDDLGLTAQAGGTLVTTGAGTIELAGVLSTDLSADDFDFV